MGLPLTLQVSVFKLSDYIKRKSFHQPHQEGLDLVQLISEGTGSLLVDLGGSPNSILKNK